MKTLDPADQLRIRDSALRMLAGREHSRYELNHKLQAKGYDHDVINLVLAELASADWLNDERFVEVFVRYRIGKGQGPLKIRADLRDRGITANMMAPYLEIDEEIWGQQAQQARIKKFGEAVPTQAKDKAKQMRFLQYRGFAFTHIKQALLGLNDSRD